MPRKLEGTNQNNYNFRSSGSGRKDTTSVKQEEDARNKGTIRKQNEFLIKNTRFRRCNWNNLSINRRDKGRDTRREKLKRISPEGLMLDQ